MRAKMRWENVKETHCLFEKGLWSPTVAKAVAGRLVSGFWSLIFLGRAEARGPFVLELFVEVLSGFST
jgi:hypothetical protein